MASESLQSCISPFFAEFKESMTLNLAQRSLNVIYFGGNQKPVYDFIQAVNSNFRSIFNRFGDIAGFIPPSNCVIK